MSALGNIIKKEIKELLTPATFLPIIVMAILFGSIGTSMGGIQDELEEKPVIGYICEDTSFIASIVTSTLDNKSEVVFNSTDIADKQKGLDEVTEQDGVALIIIKQNFTRDILNDTHGKFEVYWIMRGAGLLDSLSSEVLEGLLYAINREISIILIEDNTTVNASVALWPSQRIDTTYYKGRELTGLSPSTIAGMLSSQSMLIPIVIMMIIIMSGGIVISSMALEKENKTLETLLTLPVKRTSIVTGKIVAAALIGLILAVIYMFGMSFYFQGFQITDGLNLADYGLVLTSAEYLLMGVSLFIALIAALALCMLLGTFAKNYKSAQTLTFPVTMLALIPMFVTMFTDFETLPMAAKGFVFAIPFSHPMMASRALLFNDYLLVIGGILYSTIFTIVIIFIVVRIFNTDRLLTGSTSKWGRFFKKKF